MIPRFSGLVSAFCLLPSGLFAELDTGVGNVHLFHLKYPPSNVTVFAAELGVKDLITSKVICEFRIRFGVV